MNKRESKNNSDRLRCNDFLELSKCTVSVKFPELSSGKYGSNEDNIR